MDRNKEIKDLEKRLAAKGWEIIIDEASITVVVHGLDRPPSSNPLEDSLISKAYELAEFKPPRDTGMYHVKLDTPGRQRVAKQARDNGAR
jgi:hypothetical protein